jgi:hypothetical protein
VSPAGGGAASKPPPLHTTPRRGLPRTRNSSLPSHPSPPTPPPTPPAPSYAKDKDPALHYTAFDFHKECGATNYGR